MIDHWITIRNITSNKSIVLIDDEYAGHVVRSPYFLPIRGETDRVEFGAFVPAAGCDADDNNFNACVGWGHGTRIKAVKCIVQYKLGKNIAKELFG